MTVATAAGLVVWAAIAWLAPDVKPPRRVVVPELTTAAEIGKRAFDVSCARCHGEHAAGTAVGPPLVDRTYRSDHHADITFVFAVQRGVSAHHWRFGDMPPQPTVTDTELAHIIRYVRELQRANGVE
jgi:mono/diheme cytochrome c family protein